MCDHKSNSSVTKVASSERGVFFSMGHQLMKHCSILDSSGLCLFGDCNCECFFLR